jgi:hypothetical protein
VLVRNEKIIYRLRFEGAPSLDSDSFESLRVYSAGDPLIVEGLSDHNTIWRVSRVTAAGDGEQDTLFCSSSAESVARVEELTARRDELVLLMAGVLKRRDKERAREKAYLGGAPDISPRQRRAYLSEFAQSDHVTDAILGDFQKELAKVERQLQREEEKASGGRTGVLGRVRDALRR